MTDDGKLIVARGKLEAVTLLWRPAPGKPVERIEYELTPGGGASVQNGRLIVDARIRKEGGSEND